MGKRFFDTDLWDKVWYRLLTPAQKCLWQYILLHCDLVGVWPPDIAHAEFCIGEKIDVETFLSQVNGNIKVLENGKWFVVDFVEFQYGAVSEVSLSRVQMKIVSTLKKHGLWQADTLSRRVSDTLCHSVEEEEEEEEEDKDNLNKGGTGGKKTSLPAILFNFGEKMWEGISDEQVADWSAVYPALKIDLELGKAREWILANPTKTKKNWRRFLVNWFGRAQERGGDKPWKK